MNDGLNFLSFFFFFLNSEAWSKKSDGRNIGYIILEFSIYHFVHLVKLPR